MSTYARIPRRLQRTAPKPPAPATEISLLDRYKQWLGVSTVAAGISYATLWLAYAQFYLRLGTTPEEAGVDKTDLLSQAVVGPAVFFVCALVVIYAYAVFASVYVVLMRAQLRDLRRELLGLSRIIRGKGAPRGRKTRAAGRALFVQTFRRFAGAKGIFAIAVPGAYAFLCLLLYTESAGAAANVQRGISVVNPSVSMGISVPLVGIRATPVTVHWREEPPDGLAGTALDTQCLMHLGEADGRVLLYDVRQKKLARVAAADAVFVLNVDETLPEECAPATSG